MNYTKTLIDLRGQLNERTREMENIVTLFDAAVAAIIESHETLKAKLAPVFAGYASNTLPPRPERASRILDCEANGAHKLIEDLATGAKAQARGELSVSPDRLLDSCNRFLEFLQNNLKSSECETAINCIYSKIERFLNLIKGLSGCDPWITTEEYHKRIDKRICKLKDSFLNLGNAIVKYEFTLAEHSQKQKNTVTIDKKCEKKIKTIYKTVALGKEPSSSEIATETRHQQILFAIAQYKPRSKYNKGVSFMAAAKLAICAPQFKNVEGGYKMSEIKSLARAIGREYNHPKLDVAT